MYPSALVLPATPDCGAGGCTYMYLKLSQSFKFSCCFCKALVPTPPLLHPWRGWGAEEVEEMTNEFLLLFGSSGLR